MSFLGGTYSRGVLHSVLTVSPLHAGSGQSLGVVDLPVQRDGLGYPVVWGSSFKGALRGAATNKNPGRASDIDLVFGTVTDSGDAYAGSVYVSDLHPLAVSGPCDLGGCYFTSPYLLRVLRESIDVLMSLENSMSNLQGLKDLVDKVLVQAAGDTRIQVSSGDFLGRGIVGLAGSIFGDNSIVESSDLRGLFEVFFGLHYPDPIASSLAGRVVLLPDVMAREIIGSRLLLKTTRVSLDYKKKTVKPGALWSEEYVPAGSLFHGVFLFSKLRGKANSNNSVDETVKLFNKLTNGDGSFRPFYLLVGGHETIGKGLVRVAYLTGS